MKIQHIIVTLIHNLLLIYLHKSISGIGGEKCDECALGHVQNIPISPDHPVQTRYIPANSRPDCVPCGECFDNWERILKGINSKFEIICLLMQQLFRSKSQHNIEN